MNKKSTSSFNRLLSTLNHACHSKCLAINPILKQLFHSGQQMTLLIAILLIFMSFSQETLAQTSRTLIETYLKQEQAKNQWLASDVNDFLITDSYSDKATGITHTYAVQRYHQIPVYNAISSFTIKENEVKYFGSAFIGHLEEKVNTERPTLTARDAIDYALMHIGGREPSYAELSNLDEESKKYFFEVPEFSNRDVSVQLVFQPEGKNVILAWNVSIEMKNSSDWWNIRIDASNGRVVNEDNYTVKCNATYNVYPFPIEAASFGSRSLLCDPSNVIASPYGWHDDNGIAGAEYTITRGNNVYAYEDANNDNLPGYSPNSATLQFDFPVDFNLAPIANEDASITNLFYANNRIHDYLYNLGFNEAAGNFQTNNYGQGGSGNDYVKAEAFDGSGTNNANFNTPPDGFSGRMQMYIWNANCSSLTVASSNFNGSMSIGSATFSSLNDVTGNLVLADDGVGPFNNDACSPIVNNVSGKIALIDRGTCQFISKAIAAENAGAIGVIIANNTAGIINMGGSPNLSIPVISVSQSDGAILKAGMLAGTVTVTLDMCNANKDASFDNGIIAHEYGHGLSNRLTGGPSNTSCLSNAEQGGEGWSDWLALMMTIEPSDIGPGFLNQARGIGTYVVGQSVNGGGIRNYPYSTNMTTNPLTYANLGVAPIGTEVHNIGEVWCSALWDMSSFLINDLGFNPDPTVASAGNNIAMRLVIEGMKMQPCNPGFLDARDAILMADALIYNNAHRCRIWEAFARRGMGADANQGSAFNAADQTAGFAMPSYCSAPTQVPVAEFTSDLATISCTGTVHFTDASVQAFNWNWSFGDGGTSILQNPSHQYNSPGTYSVKLVISNPMGSDSVIHTITVTPNYSVNVTATPNLVCAGSSVQLDATATGTNFVQYNVTPATYAPLTGTLIPVSLTDDQVSTAKPIGFSFSFFGQTYTDFYICSNGYITFSSGQPASPVYGPVIPGVATPNNLIALAWNDLNPQNAGSSIGYFLTGVSPNQKLVVQYTTSHYGGIGYPFVVQAILSEGSNEIEIHTTSISDASSYDPSATTTQGVENADGTYAVAVPGRNSTYVSATNDAYRFTPFIGYTYNWLPGNLSGATQTVTPTSTTTYTVNVGDGSGCIVPVSTAPVVVNSAPVFTSCPGNQTANTASNSCDAVVTYSIAVSGTPTPSISYSFSGSTTGSGSGDGSGSTFNKGNTHVIVTASNSCGSQTCSFDVVVSDMTAPSISCDGPVTINNTPGLCHGTTTLTPPVVSDNCSTTNALNIDGIDDYIDVPHFSPAANRTIEFWINTTSFGYGDIMSWAGSTCNSIEVLTNGIGGITYAEFSCSPSVWETTTSSPINDGLWHHVAIVRTSAATNNVTIYIDGVSNATGTADVAAVTDAFSIGMENWFGSYIRPMGSSTLDEVRIWDIARSQVQIQATKDLELTGNEPGLTSYFRFNQGVANGNNSGVTTALASTGGNGVLNNFALTGPASNWVTGQSFLPNIVNDAPAVYPIGNTTVTWTATDASGNTSTCIQTVTVVAPEIDVQGGSPAVSILDDDTTPDVVDNTNFGNVGAGSTLTRTFTIHNTGAADLNISSISSSNPIFTLSALNPSGLITSGNSATFDLTFSPTAYGLELSTITINNNDCDEAVYDFSVSGNGICVAPDLAVIQAQDQSICTGGSTTLTITSGNLNDASQWQWYSGSCGGTSEGSGSTLNVTPTTTTTYYVRGEGGCVVPGSCSQITITVNPPADVNQPSGQTVCNNTASAPVNFSGSLPTFQFNWTNDQPGIGLASSGSGNIPSFTAVNTGTTPVVANITVTPVNGGNSCDTSATLTFTNNTPLAIPTGPAVVTSTIVVSGAPTYLADLNLQTFITHTFAADLDITIMSPSGRVVTLTTDNGSGNDDVFNGTIWDDSSNPAGQVPYTTNNGLVTDRTYTNLVLASPLVPEEPLGAFIGEDPNGTWTITISDDLAGDGGSLNQWSLMIKGMAQAPQLTSSSYTQNTPVAISASGASVVTSTINVTGAGTVLSDVNLTTFITHTFAADLDITITSPSGTVVTLTTDNGAGNDNVFNGTTWDDSANPGGQVPYTSNNGMVTDNTYVNLAPVSSLTPEEALAAFNGENPNGIWTLTISDDLSEDGGSLDSWTLNLQTANCQSSVACPGAPKTFTFTVNPATTSILPQTACGAYTWAGTTYTTTGTYTHTFTNGYNCDSVVTLDLTIHASIIASSSLTQCDSYIWNSTTYTVSGDYVHTYVNINGCDSVHTLHLTINNSSSSSATVTASGCYTWNANNTSYTVTGEYTVTMMNSVGCDSIATLHLTINQGVFISAKAILAGPYNNSLGLMSDSLRAYNLIPLTEPYTTAPYNRLPIGGAGGETVSPAVLAVTGNNAIVDWVMLELRDPAVSSTVLANKRALIQRDGDIVSNVDGVSPVFFANRAQGNYYVSVKHRNHLGVMTLHSVPLNSCTITNVDFSAASTVYTNPAILTAPRQTFGSVLALWSGDANTNKNAKYNGLSNDKDFIQTAVGGVININGTINMVYRSEDVNMDGKIRFNNTDNDRSVILQNVGVSTPNTIINQHTPN